ncbi:MAG: thioesterase family protein [Actinomycetota bacterium]|nr:thioesterase family protein [Actinomycetota bacterium]
MVDAYFHLIERTGPAATFRTQPSAAGPWSREHQHGGPPTALLVHAAERLAARETGRDDLAAHRVAAEFLGPVPMTDVTVEARVLRAARAAVLVEARLSAADRECLQARIWLVRLDDTTHLAAPAVQTTPPPETLPGLGATFPYADSIEWRSELGGLGARGPARIWARPRLRIVAEHEASGLARAALIGDSASGVSAELDWSVWSFLNIDLDVHLSRPVSGPWLLLDAATTLGRTGAALARATLSDLDGIVGATAQTLVVEPRRS